MFICAIYMKKSHFLPTAWETLVLYTSHLKTYPRLNLYKQKQALIFCFFETRAEVALVQLGMTLDS